MNKKWGAWVLGAALSLAATSPAQADLVTFDDILPSAYGPTETFSSGGFAFEQEDDFGYGPAGGFGVVDNAAAYLSGNAPTNAMSQFYGGLNDGALTMTTGNDRALFIDGFQFSFIPAVPGLYLEGEVPGYLVALYTTFAGATTDFELFAFSGADANGAFAFSTIGLGGLGKLAQGLRSVTFFACFGSVSSCTWPAEGQSQFALDNIYARVPEPGSLGLALLGLGLMAGVARRRRSN